MTAKRKLIRRNAHKMIAKIFEDSTTAKVYTLNNGFVGESIGVEWVKKHTANIGHAEHYDNLDGTYTIRIHSNLWYDLASENKGPDSEPDVNFPCDCSVAKGQKFTFKVLHALDVEKTGYAFADMTCENCGYTNIVRIKVISQNVIPELVDLIGSIYRRKSNCGLCGRPVWAHVYTNGDYYLSCGCGETSKRKKADFNRENFVFAESDAGAI